MSRTQMQQAQELIKKGRYKEARRILEKSDHPKASEWLAKLDKMDPPRSASKPRRRAGGGGVGRRIRSLLSYLLTIVLSAGLTSALLAGLVIITAPERSTGGRQPVEATEVADLPTPTATEPARTGVVASGQNINVRSGPGTNAEAIASLVPGTTVEVLGESEDGQWYNIRLSNGSEGWVAVDLLDAEPIPTTIADAATPEPDVTATPENTCEPEAVQLWYDTHKALLNEVRFTILQAEDAVTSGRELDYEQYSQIVRDNRSAFEAVEYPPCLEDVRATLLVGFQAADNSYQNRLRNFPNEAISELNIARDQFAAADTRLVNDIGIDTSRIDCPAAEIWFAGIEADMTTYLATIENIGLETPPSQEIRQAIFDLQELRDRLDVAVPDCALAASNRLKASVTAAVRLFQSIMAEETVANKQTNLAAMVSEATEFLNEMRRLGIRIT